MSRPRTIGLCSFLVLALGWLALSPRGALAVPPPNGKPAAHDGKAHAYWEANNRKRWRKNLRARSARTGVRLRGIGTLDPTR